MAEPPFGHEPSGVDVARVVAVGAVLVASVVLVVFVIIFAAHHLIEPARVRSHEHIGAIPPAPRLQPDAGAELRALRRQEQARLESWGWADDSRQYAHIPIERAMALYLQEHAAASDRAAPVRSAAGAR